MSNFSDRENKRMQSGGIVSAIAGIDQPTKGRPKEDRETKKRVSLAVLPSLYEDIQKIAYVERKSISEIVSKCLEEYAEKNKDKLKEYEKIKK